MPTLLAALFLVTAAPQIAEIHAPAEVLHAFRPASRVRVVSVWATWCAPCVAEIGDVQAISDHFRDKGIEVIGVSLDDMIPGQRAATKASLAHFLELRHIRFRNVYYTGSGDALADEFHFDGAIPVTLVFDENGHELMRNEGPLDRKWFMQQLETLIAKRRAAK